MTVKGKIKILEAVGLETELITEDVAGEKYQTLRIWKAGYLESHESCIISKNRIKDIDVKQILAEFLNDFDDVVQERSQRFNW